MVAQAFPTLNGVAPSWADIEIAIPLYGGPTVKTSDIAALTCSDSVEFGTVRGTSGGRKQKRTTGQEDNEASLTLYRPGHQVLMRALMQLAPTKNGQKKVGLVGFDIIVQHTPPGDTEIYCVKILGCRLAGREFNFAEGTDADQVSVPISCMQIVEVIDGQEVALL